MKENIINKIQNAIDQIVSINTSIISTCSGGHSPQYVSFNMGGQKVKLIRCKNILKEALLQIDEELEDREPVEYSTCGEPEGPSDSCPDNCEYTGGEIEACPEAGNDKRIRKYTFFDM